MNQGQRSFFNIATISILTLIVSSFPASAIGDSRSEQVKEVSNIQLTDCSESEIEILIGRWRESYLPAGAALRSCGDRAITPLTEVMADGSLRMRTRQLTARLIRQIGSEVAVQSLIAALGNYQTQEIAWASLKTMHEQPESKLLQTINSIPSDTELPSTMRAGAIRFIELYAAWQPQDIVRNTSGEMVEALLMIITDASEEANLRIWAANALATLVYETGGDYPTEILRPEMLAGIVTSENDLAVSQSTMNVLMMTYYLTVTHNSCLYRTEERDELERVLLSIENRSNTGQGLTATSDEANQTRRRAAFRNVMDITHPNRQESCGSYRDIPPGVYFINHVKGRNQPRLLEQLIQWADTLR